MEKRLKKIDEERKLRAGANLQASGSGLGKGKTKAKREG